jgi:hypothetical protein
MTKQEKTETVAEELQACTSITTEIPKNMEAMSDIDILSTMLSIYSPSGAEHPMIAYVTQYLTQHKIDYEIDTAGNIYFSNDVEGDKRILLNAHMDTVGSAAPDIMVEQINGQTVIHSTNNQVIGGDDKCGVFAVLRIISNKAVDTPLSGLLTVSEETGCNGARHAMDNHSDKFSDVVFNITIDRNGNTDIITQNSDYKLCSDEMDKMLDEWGKPFKLRTTSGSISDVSEIVSTLDINGINLFAGYYKAHTGSEYIIMEHLYESMAFTKVLLPKLHKLLTDHPEWVEFKATKATYTWSGYRGASYYGYEEYNGIKYYGGGNSWTKKVDSVDVEEQNDSIIELFDALDRIEGEEGQYAGLDRIIEDEDIRVSSSGKSIVIPEAFVNYYGEIDIIEDYIPVAQNGYDAVISINDIKEYLKSWSVLEEGFDIEEE